MRKFEQKGWVVLNELNMKKNLLARNKLQVALNVCNIKRAGGTVRKNMFSINWFTLPNHVGSSKICLHSVVRFTLTLSFSF